MTLYYLSFATDKSFLGATIVDAEGEIEAIATATLLGRNPGGEVMILEVPPGAEGEELKILQERLMTKEELMRFGTRRLADMTAEEREIIEGHASMVCKEHNRKH